MVELSADLPAPPASPTTPKVLGVGFLAEIAYLSAFMAVLLTATPTVATDPRKFAESFYLVSQLGDCIAKPVGSIVLLLLAGSLGLSRRDLLGLRPPTLPQTLFWTAMMGLLLGGYPYLARRIGLVPESEHRFAVSFPVFWLAAIVAAPLYEELLFRGLLLEGLRRSRLGPWLALAVTSVLFAEIHVPHSAYAFVSLLASGLLFGAARLATGSLYLVIGLHCVFNIVVLTQTALYYYSHS